MELEVSYLIDVVTTHKTDFFREPRHFEYLTQKVVPQFTREERFHNREMRLWSAACSTGEEPYTLAMVLADYAARVSRFSFSILATDISHGVLEAARLGIYALDRIGPVPAAFRVKYLSRSKDATRKELRIVPELRSTVYFYQTNLLEPFRVAVPMDVIFCRNVLIYFDRPAQAKLIAQFYQALSPGGYLILGHSETLTGLRQLFAYEAATVYRKDNGADLDERKA